MILDLESFLSSPGNIIDVRTPLEYAQGHIPGAVSIPIFSNEERIDVGITYKKIGKQAAIDLGLKIIGPKLVNLVSAAREVCSNSIALKIYCWRGGMRSQSLHALFNSIGIPSHTLKGGYKSFRRHMIQLLQMPKTIVVLGGLTGSGKTELLNKLEIENEQVLNLESLACHRGSSYGMLGMPSQPTNEHFENLIAMKWRGFSNQKIIWIEDESRMIGRCKIPDELFKQIKTAPLAFIETHLEDRIQNLCTVYSEFDENLLIEATLRLKKKLGLERTIEALAYLKEKKPQKLVKIVLEYYDRTYMSCLKKYPRAIYKFNKPSVKDLVEQIYE